MLVGMGSPVVTVPLAAAATREVDVLGSFRYANTYPEALQLLAASSSALAQSSLATSRKTDFTKSEKGAGLLPDVRCLITHRLSLHDAQDAFALVQKGQDARGGLVLKVMVTCGAEEEEEESSDDD